MGKSVRTKTSYHLQTHDFETGFLDNCSDHDWNGRGPRTVVPKRLQSPSILTSFTSCCSVWLAKCSVFKRCFCKGSSGIPLQISSPSLIAAGASNGGGSRYWDFIASGTYIVEKEDDTWEQLLKNDWLNEVPNQHCALCLLLSDPEEPCRQYIRSFKCRVL